MDWHPVISVQQDTWQWPLSFQHFKCMFSILGIFSNTGKTRVSHRVKMMTRWPGRERWPKRPTDPVTQWPSSMSGGRRTCEWTAAVRRHRRCCRWSSVHWRRRCSVEWTSACSCVDRSPAAQLTHWRHLGGLGGLRTPQWLWSVKVLHYL